MRATPVRRHSRRRLSWAALTVVLAVVLVVGTGSRGEQTRAERARSFADTVKCPTCRSQSVASSDAPVAAAIRADIDARFEEGQNEEQVRQYLLATYGDEVLLTPPRTGVGSLVWILPVAGLLIALGALTFTFRRWRLDAASPSASAADRELVASAMGGTSRSARAGTGANADGDREVDADGDREVDADGDREVDAELVSGVDPHGEGDGR